MSRDFAAWFRIGHTTWNEDRTGCTVILLDRLAPAWADVRGGAPGTRETDLLGPGRLVGSANAILLTGGSAFGLAAADGVMRYLQEGGEGVPTSAGPVPIVTGAVIFDLANGIHRSPTADDGYAACLAASSDLPESGKIGAGAGATVAKLGAQPAQAGGLGVGVASVGETQIVAIVVLNAAGDIVDPTNGELLSRLDGIAVSARPHQRVSLVGSEMCIRDRNTTIGAILIGEPVDQLTLARSAIAAHDALARCVVPAHTLFDGDTFFVAAPARADVAPQRVVAISSAVEVAVERAIVGLFKSAP